MSVAGPARLASDRVITKGDELDGGELVELGPGARLHFRHTASGRDWTAHGPARLLPCAGGEEEIIMARGTLRIERGAGVRPGAEVLVGTPFGSIRYADARAELVIAERDFTLTTSAGEVWLEGPEPASELRVSRSARRGHAQRLTMAPAIESCARAADEAMTLAKGLLVLGEGLGARAAAHVRARQRARSRCASAAAAALEQAPSVERAARLRELDGYRQSWRHIPASKS